jgi:hypothetical protein
MRFTTAVGGAEGGGAEGVGSERCAAPPQADTDAVQSTEEETRKRGREEMRERGNGGKGERRTAGRGSAAERGGTGGRRRKAREILRRAVHLLRLRQLPLRPVELRTKAHGSVI